MYGIDLLMKEHENIVALTKHLRRTCCAVIEGADIDVQEFLECIDLQELMQTSIIMERKNRYCFGLCLIIPILLQKNWCAMECWWNMTSEDSISGNWRTQLSSMPVFRLQKESWISSPMHRVMWIYCSVTLRKKIPSATLMHYEHCQRNAKRRLMNRQERLRKSGTGRHTGEIYYMVRKKEIGEWVKLLISQKQFQSW